jgi:hypothetical protein
LGFRRVAPMIRFAPAFVPLGGSHACVSEETGNGHEICTAVKKFPRERSA